jgi:hypothetical protein
MDAKQVRIHDLVRKANTAHLGLVDRTDKEVNSHVPKPQADYSVEIQRHKSVSKDDFRVFMKHGKVRASRNLLLEHMAYKFPASAAHCSRLLGFRCHCRTDIHAIPGSNKQNHRMW